MKIYEHNTQTDVAELREMTGEELIQWQNHQDDEVRIAAEKTELEEAKKAAEAKLAALGLTTDDLKALGL